MPHPNSLGFNFPPFWPAKCYWFARKSLQLILIRDFPEVPDEKHPDAKISRSYFPVPAFMKH